MDATKAKFTTSRQICELIPPYLIPKLAKKHNVEEKRRTFRALSHMVSLVFAQLSLSLSLNDVCDTLQKSSRPAEYHQEGHAAGAEHAVARQPQSEPGDGRGATVLGNVGAFGAVVAAVRRGEMLCRPSSPLQKGGSRHGFLDDPAGGQLHGLGKAPQTQGGGQDAFIAELERLSAQLCRGGRREA